MNASTSLQKEAYNCNTFRGKCPITFPSFSTAITFLSWEFPGSATHTSFASFTIPYLLVHRVPFGTVYLPRCLRPFSPFHLISRGLILVGDRFHENLTPWKCYPQSISLLKFPRLQFCCRFYMYSVCDTCTSPHPCTAQHFWCLLLVPIVEWHLSHLCRLMYTNYSLVLLHFSSVGVDGLLYTLKDDLNKHKWHLTRFITCLWWPV